MAPVANETRVPSAPESPESPDDLDYFYQSEEERETVLYLAFGSNLCHKSFQERRGVKPLRQVNVQVPELKLVFDLPGIPYLEPCFANSARVPHDPSATPPLKTTYDYHKDRWTKGLIGVVYAITPHDYSTIISTEGGGSSYSEIRVSCFPLPSSSTTVPDVPTTKPFTAKTLFADLPDSDEGNKTPIKRPRRPDHSYAQPSARYLKLIADGCREHNLPAEYQSFVADIRPYRITSLRQRVGARAYYVVWFPIVMFVFGLQRLLQDRKTGKSPLWLARITQAVFRAAWGSYDRIFKGWFGDGERSIPDGGVGSGSEGMIRLQGGEREKGVDDEDEGGVLVEQEVGRESFEKEKEDVTVVVENLL